MEWFHRVVAAKGEAGGRGGPQPAPQKRLPQSAPTPPERGGPAPCKTLHSTSLHLPALARLLSAHFPPASGRVPSPTSGL